MKRLAILGASGHGKVVAEAAELSGWDEVFFFDDAWPEKSINTIWPVIGKTKDLLARLNEFAGVVVAIGDSRIRLSKMNELRARNVNLPVIIHPQAIVSRHTEIGEGSVILAGAIVNTDTKIGAGAILNTGCSVGHDCTLADGVHISSGTRLAGGVVVGEGAWVGIGSVVRQLVTVGAYSVVGAGAAVVKDVPDHAVVMGVPAK